MASKIQFINSTRDTSSATRKAQRKLARSHVTTRRHFEQRQRDIEEFEAKRSHQDTSFRFQQISSPTRYSTISQRREIPGSLETFHHTIVNTTQFSLQFRQQPAPAREDATTPNQTISRASNNDPLTLESQGGHLFEIPLRFPMFRMVSGRMDPFKPLPGHLTPRMRPHIYYCT